jgi:hypothetical protein
MNSKLTGQEIEELRIAIAEEMGWANIRKHGKELVNTPGYLAEWIGSPPSETLASKLPPYTTSIDSIREAAMERFGQNANNQKFHDSLNEMANNRGEFIHELSALDWSIAFARTAKIWRYKV